MQAIYDSVTMGLAHAPYQPLSIPAACRVFLSRFHPGASSVSEV